MNLVSRYIRYLKDNPEHHWFKRKPFGWGWTPATTEGWITIGIFLWFVLWKAHDFALIPDPSEPMVQAFLFQILVAVIVLLFICYLTGEEPRWHWGLPRE